MSLEDRERWERRHGSAATLNPRGSVLALPRARASTDVALDLACGQGRHVAALCSLGYRVVAMDISRNALQRTRAAVAAGADGVLAVQGDADAWPFGPEVFDLVVQVDFLDRGLFPMLRSALRRGGLLLIDTFLDDGSRNAEGPSRPAFLLAAGELPRTFSDFDILRYEESPGDTARAVFLGRKP